MRLLNVAQHAGVEPSVAALLAQVHCTVLVHIRIPERRFIILDVIAVHDLLLVFQVHSGVQILSSIMFHSDAM